MTQEQAVPLTLTEKDELTRMAIDEDTAVSLVEWVEARLAIEAEAYKAGRDGLAPMYVIGVVGTALREHRVGFVVEQHVLDELRAALATPSDTPKEPT